jgi:hypothetical protein
MPTPRIPFGQQGEYWPSGTFKVIAYLEVEDRWVAEVFGKIIEDVEDGLGRWVGSGGKLPSGIMAELIRYELQFRDANIFELRIDSRADEKQALAEFMLTAGLAPEAVRWPHPDA